MADKSNAADANTTVPTPASDGAWKIHEVQSAWIEKADVKASIILTLEAAILGFVTVLSTNDQVLANFHGLKHAAVVVAMGSLLLSTLFSLGAVLPQLGRPRSTEDGPGVIYFGDVRRWNSGDLADAVRQGRPTVDDVAKQVVALAAISWCKHTRLRRSIFLLTLGLLLLAASLA